MLRDCRSRCSMWVVIPRGDTDRLSFDSPYIPPRTVHLKHFESRRLQMERDLVVERKSVMSATFVTASPTGSFLDVRRDVRLGSARRAAYQAKRRQPRVLTPCCVAAGVAGDAERPPWASSTASPGPGGDNDDGVVWETICGCPTALPAAGSPQGVVHLLGGLGACAAPEKFYRRLVCGVAATAQVAVVCVPMPAVPGLDHGAVARSARARIDAALSEIRLRYGPRFHSVAMGHSLGARLQTIHAARHSLDDVGVVLLSFANGDASAAVVGADSLRGVLSGGAAGMVGDVLQRAAENVGGPIGETLRAEAARAAANVEKASASAADALGNMEFTPNRADLLRAVSEGYEVKRTLVVRYDRDSLDNSDALVEAIRRRNGEKAVVLRLMQGTHVTPFTLKFGEVLRSTGFDVLDEGLQSLRRGADSEIDQTVNTVSAFVKLVMDEANTRSNPQLNSSD